MIATPISSAPPAPPALPPREGRILDAFLACDDLPTLLARENLSAHDLLAWSAHPAVQSALATLRSLITFQAEYRQSSPRLKAIDTLTNLLRDSDNLVERRRAATTILRIPAFPRNPARPRPAPAGRGASHGTDCASNRAHPLPVPKGRGAQGPSESKPRPESPGAPGVPVPTSPQNPGIESPGSPPPPPFPEPALIPFPRLPATPSPAYLLRTRAGTTCGPP